MSKKPVTENEKGELNQLRSLLFGDQAQQTEDRLESLETAINSLRRENRQLRHALEVEAMSRLDADREQGETLTGTYDVALSNLSDILQGNAAAERKNRQAQLNAMVGVLEKFQSNQDDATAKLIAQLEAEKAARAAQFAKLKEQLAASNVAADSQADSLTGLLKGFVKEHASNEPQVVADAVADVVDKGNSAETEK